MTAIAMLLAAAAIGFGLSRWLSLPVIPFLIVAGFVLAAAGFGPDPEILQDTLILGLAFLVFAAGIELNVKRVGEQYATAVRVAVVQFAGLGAAGFAASLLLGFGVQTSLYLALALTASSTLVVGRLLQTRRQQFEPFGRTVLGVLLLQDLFIILLIPVVTRLPDGPGAVIAGVLGAAALTALAAVFVKWITPYLVLRLKLDEETLLLVALAILFGFAGISIAFGLPLVAGAFLAGISLSLFPINGKIRGLLDSLSDFFLAIFFTALGAVIVIPAAEYLWRALILVGIVILVTPPLVTVIAERSGLSARPAIESGLLLAQTSEFSLVVALQGLVLGHLTEEVFSIIALITVLTMILTPFMATDGMTWRLMRFHPLRKSVKLKEMPRGHVLLLGCGDNGMPLLETLLSMGHEVVVVDDDPAVVQRISEGGVSVIRGDGSDFAVLRAAGAKHARVIISTLRRPKDAEAVVRYVPDRPVIVRVFDDADAETIEAAGGTAVRYADAAANDFFQWLEQAESVGIENERRMRPR